MPNNNASKLTHDLLRSILKLLALKPRLKAAARGVGIDPSTLFNYIARSQRDDPELKLSWLGVERQFHEHVNIARKLSIVALDHSARDQAINGWSEPKFHDGKPVWKIDPQLASDAEDPEWWKIVHGDRPITDIFVRDIDGALIQDEVNHPPNPQLLVKMLASLAPDLYGDHSTVEHHHTHTGHVWVEGQANKQVEHKGDEINEAFQMADKPDAVARPQNVLAVPAQMSTEAYDAKFTNRKLVREVVISRDVTGKVERPLPDDIIVEGSYQHRIFKEEFFDIDKQTVTAQSLIEAGYTNDFLFKLVYEQGVKPSAPKPQAPPKSTLDDDPADSPLVRDLKRKARESVQQPYPRGAHGERLDPRTAVPPRVNDPPDDTLGRQTRTRVGEGREHLGHGEPAAGGYSTTARRGAPQGFTR